MYFKRDRRYLGADWEQIIAGPYGITRNVVEEFTEYAQHEAYIDAAILLNQLAKQVRQSRGDRRGYPLRQSTQATWIADEGSYAFAPIQPVA